MHACTILTDTQHMYTLIEEKQEEKKERNNNNKRLILMLYTTHTQIL